MSAFFDAFWPNLAATLVGIVLGAPIALAINQRMLSKQRRLQADDARAQIKDAIDVLVSACKYNIGVLKVICGEALAGRAMHSPDLRVTTWDAVGQILCASSSNPELLQMLSHHWLRLQRLQVLSDEIFAREVAKSLPPIEDQSIMLEFWRVLHDNSLSLSAHAEEAVKKLEMLRKSMVDLDGTTSSR
ncbi:hypothetical protein MJ904_07415 [Massilia sp. MB5]|uniref:hypothetical protein n=1 Tax=Massilia sp. MB5 TaxID=2919578 RepID=UPI001F0F1039|nr:hypothetical protein [Massilia sp. MB5]UMR31995.1 hypothetical protein MJ904_07415 [Massilia sp. MB5]